MSDPPNPYGQRAVWYGALAFLAGRGVSAILTLLAFALAARLLPLTEYGLYMAALAAMELGLAFSTAGLDWVATRCLPEYRLHASGRATVLMALKLCAVQALAFLLGGILLVLCAPLLAELLRLEEGAYVIRLAGVLLGVEGIGRLSRDQMLGVLMHQRSSQLAQVARSGVLLALLVQAHMGGAPLRATHVMNYELAAGGVAAILGALLLGRVLLKLWGLPAATERWVPPDLRTLQALARNSYFSYLLALSYGAQVLTMLFARFLGQEAAAVFGFARSFADQVRRYLPTDLLQSILRPAAVAYFSATQDHAGLMLRLGIWLKSALIVLIPLIVFFTVFGELGASALGGQHFRGAWPIVLVMLFGAGTMAWRRIAELACNTLNRSGLCVRAALPMPAVPLLLAATLHATQSLLPAASVFVCAEICFCWRVQYLLARDGLGSGWQGKAYLRMVGSAVISSAILLVIRDATAANATVAVVATLAVAVSALFLLRPFDRAEIALLRDWRAAMARGSETSR